MSADVEQLESKLAELQGERDGLLVARTKEGDSRLRKIAAEIEAATAELRERKKALAIEEIERQFSPEAA